MGVMESPVFTAIAYELNNCPRAILVYCTPHRSIQRTRCCHPLILPSSHGVGGRAELRRGWGEPDGQGRKHFFVIASDSRGKKQGYGDCFWLSSIFQDKVSIPCHWAKRLASKE